MRFLATAAGWAADEAALHRKFRRLRSGYGQEREFFRPTPSLYRMIERVTALKDEISMHLVTVAQLVGREGGRMPIPTLRDFQNWMDKHRAALPIELQNKGERVILALKSITGLKTAPHPLIMRLTREDVDDFAAAYAAWKGI